MANPHTKTEIVEALRVVQTGLSQDVHHMTPEQFDRAEEGWTAAGYLKHLLLSIKPLVRVYEMPPENILRMFRRPEHTPRSYADLCAAYNMRLAEGIRAEDYDKVVPEAYRMPDDVTDARVYLAQSWNEAHERLFAALDGWTDADLDAHQVPHPALKVVTLREMLFFTLHHNTLHWRDMQRVGLRIT
ncbi:MAG: DinB family protein [bacterium]|nr:DinB family protein [bacterium]